MDSEVQDRLVEVKTRLLTAGVDELQAWAKKYLPLLSEDVTSRPALVMAFETYITDKVLKEEDCITKLTELLTGFGAVHTTAVVKEGPISEEKGEVESKKTVEVVKTFRRDFKISGSIGDGPNCIGYLSFIRQLEVGQTNGYTECELVDGVIRAIQTGSKLRGYLEGRRELSLSKLQSIVRAAYKEKSATELYQELCSLRQDTKENIQEFIFRALELKQKISFACKKSDLPSYDEQLITHQFRHSVSTGIRNENIRTEALSILKTFKTDEGLIEEMNEIERRHQEREAELKPKREVASVIAEESTVLKELKALRLEVSELRSKQSGSEPTGRMGIDKRRSKQTRACENCSKNNQRSCRHCWICGAGDHLFRQCPKNDQRSMEQGGR